MPTPTLAPQQDVACITPGPTFRQPSDPSLTFTVTTDRPVYGIGEPVAFTLTVTNPNDAPVTILTNLLPEFIVRSVATGTAVWRSVSHPLPIPRPLACTFAPGATKTYSAVWNQRGSGTAGQEGPQVPPGIYAVTGSIFGETRFGESGLTSAPVQFTIGEPAPGEGVRLFAGCNNVSLTWPSGTPTSEVAAAVSPSGALVAVWRYDVAQGRFLGFAPQFPQASDLTTVNGLDAVFICTREPGTLTRPVI